MIIGIESKRFSGKAMTFDELQTAVSAIFKTKNKESFIDEFCTRVGYKKLPYSEGYADYMIDLNSQIVFVTPHTFPKELDGAKVLYYTEKGDFEPIYHAGGEIAHKVFYLAICKYDSDKDYCIFHVDENLKVVADGCLESLEACRKFMNEYSVAYHTHKEQL